MKTRKASGTDKIFAGDVVLAKILLSYSGSCQAILSRFPDNAQDFLIVIHVGKLIYCEDPAARRLDGKVSPGYYPYLMSEVTFLMSSQIITLGLFPNIALEVVDAEG